MKYDCTNLAEVLAEHAKWLGDYDSTLPIGCRCQNRRRRTQMRIIDADVLKKDLTHFYNGEVTAKELIDEQPTVGGWISVKDRLPTHYERVPVLTKFRDSNNFYTSWLWYVHAPFCEVGDEHWEQIGFVEYEVVYWYELPEPPKEGTEE